MKRKLSKLQLIICIIGYVLTALCLFCTVGAYATADIDAEMAAIAPTALGMTIVFGGVSTFVLVKGLVLDSNKRVKAEKEKAKQKEIDRQEEAVERERRKRAYEAELAREEEEKERKKQEEWEKQMAIAELEKAMAETERLANELAESIERKQNALVDLICAAPMTSKMVCPYCEQELACELVSGKIGYGTRRRQKGVITDAKGNEKPIWEDFSDEITIPVYRQTCQKCGLTIQGAGEIPEDVIEIDVNEYVKRAFYHPTMSADSLRSVEGKIKKWKEKNNCYTDDFAFAPTLK